MRVPFEDPSDLLVQEEIEDRRPELVTMLAGRDAAFVRTTMTWGMARALASSIDRSTNASWGSPGTHLTPPRCRPTRRSPTTIPHRQRRRRRKPAAADETRTAGTSPVERRRITDAAMALARSDQDLTRLSPERHLRADV